MTTMSKVRAWSFAAFVGALALGDWQVGRLVADGEEEGIPAAQVNGVKIRAELKDVAAGDATEKHWMLALSGDGKGEMTLTCTKTPWNPMARMIPAPTVVWTKKVAFDTSASRTIDLGKAPEKDTHQSFALVLGSGDESEGLRMQIRLAVIQPTMEESMEAMKQGDGDGKDVSARETK